MRRFALLVALALTLCGCHSVAGTTSPTGTPPAATLRVVALGDSVVAGTGCDCRPFPQRYAALVTDHLGRAVDWKDDGVNGLTSAGLLSDLRSGRQADDVRAADVVLVTVGANDLNGALAAYPDGGCPTSCSTAALPDVGRNLGAIVARIRALAGDRVVVGVTDYWNVFEDGQVADADHGPGFAAWSDRLTRQANAVICRSATSAGATCVDLYVPFEYDPVSHRRRDPTPLLAADGDHPNAAGHALIARTLAAHLMP